MFKLFLIMLFLTGCSENFLNIRNDPYANVGYDEAVQSVYKNRESLQAATARRDLLKQQLEIEKQQKEIDRLKNEIADLNDQIKQLNYDIENAQKRVDKLNNQAAQDGDNDYGGYGSGAVQTGPRGGKYVITPSGKKRYIKR